MLNQLLAMRLFVRVAEAGSFRQAAEQLSLPRSTASKLVGDLEAHLGCKLVQRTTRKVTLTTDGAAYLERAVRALAEIDAADDAARGTGLKPAGRLRVDVPSSVAHHLLIPALSGFRQLYPDIEIALGVGDRSVSIVGEGVDCVIRGGTLQDPTLIARKLVDLDYGTFASRDYVARHGLPDLPGELHRHDIVAYRQPHAERAAPLVFERGDKHIEIEGASVTANDGEAHIGLTRAGFGVGQHFVRFVQPLVDRGELIRILTDWTRPAFPFHAVHAHDRHRSARLRAFMDWLPKIMRDEG